jgi:predicted transcriptional regulator of viral defense system
VRAMNYIKRIEKIINEQNGTLLSSDLDEYNIPRTYLSMMVAEGKIERIGRGIYALPDALEDEMYIMQKKYPNLIYSHETALFFHEISDRTPFEYSVTVPSGYKVVDTINERFNIYYIKRDLHLMGVTELETTLGNTIRIYNLERTICDLLRSRNRIDIQIFSDALKRVVKKKHLDYVLLSEYARKLNVENILNTYMEVLL